MFAPATSLVYSAPQLGSRTGDTCPVLVLETSATVTTCPGAVAGASRFLARKCSRSTHENATLRSVPKPKCRTRLQV